MEWMMNLITFRTATQAAIFEKELVGQFSDGMWENASPSNHWKPWSEAKVEVGGVIGRNFWVQKDGYDLHHPMLLDVVGARMITYAQSVNGGAAYGMAELKKDLTEIKKAMKTRIA
jgi:hypothetical protein